jgi:hypothetical protein
MPSHYAIVQKRALLHDESKKLALELAEITGDEVTPFPQLPGWMDAETKANEEREWANAITRQAIDTLRRRKEEEHASQVSDGQ